VGRGCAERNGTLAVFTLLLNDLLLFLTTLTEQHPTHSAEYTIFGKLERLITIKAIQLHLVGKKNQRNKQTKKKHKKRKAILQRTK